MLYNVFGVQYDTESSHSLDESIHFLAWSYGLSPEAADRWAENFGNTTKWSAEQVQEVAIEELVEEKNDDKSSREEVNTFQQIVNEAELFADVSIKDFKQGKINTIYIVAILAALILFGE